MFTDTFSRVSLQFWFLLVLILPATGCGSGATVLPHTDAEKNLSWVVVAYQEAYSKLNRPPKNVEELTNSLKDFGDPEKLLVSPNDGEPFVIVWGVNPGQGGPTPYKGMWQIIAYDKKGKGGMRVVCDIRGHSITIPEEDLSQLTFVRGHKPAAN
jgi:hypothetical protein